MKIDKKILKKIPLIRSEVFVAIVGSRTYNDYEYIKTKIEYYTKNFTQKVVIVSGGAKGVDTAARKYAKEKNLTLIEYLPDWTLGKGAGMMRNKDIINQADVCIAFLKDNSPGTSNSISLAETKGIPLRVVKIAT